MKDLTLKWEQITAKVKLVLEHNLKLGEEITQLKAKIDRLEKDKQELIREKESLNKNINVLKLAKGVGLSDNERNEVKKQIRHYINEIDDCLAKINP